MSSDINEILNPKLLSDFREDMPPVRCMLWKGGNQYETLTFEDIYWFDTLEQLKRMICHAKKGDARYDPMFLFVGVPVDSEEEKGEPTLTTMYYPLDYLWYPMGSSQSRDAYRIRHPLRGFTSPDMRFVTETGEFASPNIEYRGRSTMEHVFTGPGRPEIPIFHVYPFHLLYEAYRGIKPISEMEWNKKFAPYFPEMTAEGPFLPREKEKANVQQIARYVALREQTLYRVNEWLTAISEFPEWQVSGIQHMSLLWKTPVPDFQGCASLFYETKVTARRPYLRLLPAEGSGVTKIHVDGILPIPTLHDPRVMESWSKEVSPTPKNDFLCVKYVHRPVIGTSPPIYGTIHVLNDGTMKWAVQPPKTVRLLHPNLDFRTMDGFMNHVLEGFPQPLADARLHDVSLVLTLRLGIMSERFTKKRLLQRLPFFQTFFREIQPLPGMNPILSLRYKAVSQFVSENEVFSFITLRATQLALEEGEQPPLLLVQAIQNEFQLAEKEALMYFMEWLKRKGQFTVENPEEGDFSESFHPGVDLHLYGQHPAYYVHIHRMDQLSTYRRIYALLSLLFMEDNGYYLQEDVRRIERVAEEMENREEVWEENQRQKEEDIEERLGDYVAEEKEPMATGLLEDWGVLEDPLALNVEPAIPLPEKPVAAKAVRPAASPAHPSPLDQDPREIESRRVQPKEWFIRKLKQLDARLFHFTTGVKGDNGYSRSCPATEDRQPVIMTKDQYDMMRKVYEQDKIYWIIYPLEGTEEPKAPVGTEETITVLRFGSDVNTIHYMFCPRFYCLLDEIMVREVDLMKTTDRQGRPKPQNTCPFCHGGRLTTEDQKRPTVEGRTVVERKKKKGSTAVHDQISFLGTTTHPEGLSLPCCFIRQKSLRIKDERFAHIRSQLQEIEVEEQLQEDGSEIQSESQSQWEEDGVEKERVSIPYRTLLDNVYRKYILEPNRFPRAGWFATASPAFDRYFQQDSSRQLVSRVAVQLKLRPNAEGFLRLGVDNPRYQSLLGAMAPLLQCSSIDEVIQRIEDVLQPRIFLNAHFGNLVMEFFRPEESAFMPETSHELMKWADESLGIRMTSSNSYALLRIYNAHTHFIAFLKDPTQRKELRHLQPLLAEPGLFRMAGIQLLVLENKGEGNPVEVRCPSFGISPIRHKINDVVFMSRTMRGIGTSEEEYPHYELYVYTKNQPARGGQPETHHTTLLWENQSYESWPEMVQLRVQEYRSQCESLHRSIYTPQRGIAESSMIPLSNAVEGSKVRPEGIVKDHSNHIVGITFRSKIGSSLMVMVPVVDDGVISISSAFSIKSIYLDWEDIKLAPVEDVVKYYRERIKTSFSLYKGYEVEKVVKDRLTGKVVAIQLANGVYVPVADTSRPDALVALGLNIVAIDRFEYVMNKQMSGTYQRGYTEDTPWEEWTASAEVEKGCGKDESLDEEMTVHHLDELYQQFRVMVSQWLLSQRAGTEMRRTIEGILFRKDLPFYERRKRLSIWLTPIFFEWFDEEDGPLTPTRIRRDCRVMTTPESCTGSCRWKEDAEGQRQGKCRLHVPSAVKTGGKGGSQVRVVELFIKRVLDELVRFPTRRKQLLTKDGISRVTRVTEPIREGNQYILPESSSTWLDLLRLDWMYQPQEKPKYYEEMSREPEDLPPPQEERMPPKWYDVFGEESPFVVEWSDQPDTPFVPFMSLLGMTLEEWGIQPKTIMPTQEEWKQYAKKTRRSVGYVHWSEEKYDAQEPEIQWVRTMGGMDRSVVFVIMGQRVGLIMEEGQPMIRIDSLPDRLRQVWDATPITSFLKRPTIIKRSSNAPPPPQEVILPPAPLIKKRPVLIKQAPLVSSSSGIPTPMGPPSEPLPSPPASASSSSSSLPAAPLIKKRPTLIKQAPPAPSPAPDAPAPVSSPMVPPIVKKRPTLLSASRPSSEPSSSS